MRDIDGVEKMLAYLMVFFSLLMVLCAFFLPNDGSLFTALSGVIGNCSGALFMKIKGGKDPDPPPPTAKL